MTNRDALSYPEADRVWLENYLPGSKEASERRRRPWVTLTFATSLDSGLALAPGQQTALSGPRSKAMTHYLRSRHDAIMIGVGTAVCDDPSLNCRLNGVGGYGSDGPDGQPRPVVLDPTCRWNVQDSKVLKLSQQGRGRAPLVVCSVPPPIEKRQALESAGGAYVILDNYRRASPESQWRSVLEMLEAHGLRSVMIEGGGKIINDLLLPNCQQLIDAVVVTIAPVWLGHGAVTVAPKRDSTSADPSLPVASLRQPRWTQLDDDVVLCGGFRFSRMRFSAKDLLFHLLHMPTWISLTRSPRPALKFTVYYAQEPFELGQALHSHFSSLVLLVQFLFVSL